MFFKFANLFRIMLLNFEKVLAFLNSLPLEIEIYCYHTFRNMHNADHYIGCFEKRVSVKAVILTNSSLQFTVLNF